MFTYPEEFHLNNKWLLFNFHAQMKCNISGEIFYYRLTSSVGEMHKYSAQIFIGLVFNEYHFHLQSATDTK